MSATLVTGATGFLGRELTGALLAADPQLRLVALVRARARATLEQRLESLRAPLAPADRGRVVAIAGDVTRPRLGLDGPSYERLIGSVDRVLHLAANTRFDLSLDEARRQNVGGTQAVLAICRSLRERGRTGRLDYVSTAYVAGDRAGLVGEDELDAGQCFRNTYEHSKHEAERLCRDARSELPVAVYRPSIIVGRAATGETTSWTTIYQPMSAVVRFYDVWHPLIRLVRLPMRPECPLDLVPVDWVAHAIAALAARPDAAGRSFHLAAGPDRAITIGEAVRQGCRAAGVPLIRFVDPRQASVRLLARALHPAVRRLAPRAVRLAELYQPYTVRNPSFDTTNLRATGLEPPSSASYFTQLFAFARATDFGRRPHPDAGGSAARRTSEAA